MSKITHLPVTEGRILRANLKKRPFARNRGPHFTGKSQESAFCP
ncbi:vitamin B12-binding protein [Ligilactobacillus ruminis]|nr:vitamin B12-binding protein [Ligilactobacillus ruminis]WDC81039.1 vitamin B12-binding protein [Ligilactobacillus ruminis]